MPEQQRPHRPLLLAALPAVRDHRTPAAPWPRTFADAVLAAELAGLDALVVERGDGGGPGDGDRDGYGGDAPAGPALDPLLALALLAPRTHRLGLVAELPAHDPEPARTAAELASLDAISGGRAGWLVSTPGRTRVGHAATPPAGTGATAVLLTRAEPGEAAAELAGRLAPALADPRTGALLVRFPGGPAALRRFAHETLPLLRGRGLLPAPERGPRRLRERLGPPLTTAA
ncbi:LLM class flavin-dependent oxidoreductase [Streptomyces sp. NPDC090077]|uniref:LLM class flavin-dependent oxidoreductase n=1 Tax=Streptomyces sp. NPDC090077 TaxID=3365938 RepID=UPI0037FBDC6C